MTDELPVLDVRELDEETLRRELKDAVARRDAVPRCPACRGEGRVTEMWSGRDETCEVCEGRMYLPLERAQWDAARERIALLSRSLRLLQDLGADI